MIVKANVAMKMTSWICPFAARFVGEGVAGVRRSTGTGEGVVEDGVGVL